MTLVWDGLSLPINSGFWEWGGTGDGSPPLSQRVAEATSFGSVTPPNGCSVLQRIICAPGDVYSGSTGWRTLSRQHNPIQTRPIGFDSNMVMAVFTPAGYPSDAGMYVCPLEYHHTSPNGTTGVVPAAITMDQNGLRFRLWGGTTNASGGVGNPGHTITLDKTYDIKDRGVWHVILCRLKYGFKDNSNVNLRGAAELWHGIPGPNASMVSLSGSLTNINCGYGTLSYYPLFGLYRGQNGSSTTTIYLAGSREYTTTTEALAWANTMLGGTGGGGPPPPPPDPDPNDLEPANYLGGAYQVTPRSAHGSQTNKQRCYKVVVQNTGTVTALGTYREPQQVTGTETVKLAVWPDNGTGTDPGSGSPLGMTGELAFTSASASGRYSANVTSSFGVSAGQVVWIGELSGGTANISFTRAANSGLFRLMDAAYTGGVVAWDTTTDSEFPLDLTTWMTGTLGAGQPPANVTAPVITGSAVLGSTLTLTTPGQWAGPAPTFTYTWQSINTSQGSGNGFDLNTHGTTYVTQPADRGLWIQCRVQAVNALGTTLQWSNRIGPIFTVADREPVGHRIGGRTVRSGRRAGQGGGGI